MTLSHLVADPHDADGVVRVLVLILQQDRLQMLHQLFEGSKTARDLAFVKPPRAALFQEGQALARYSAVQGLHLGMVCEQSCQLEFKLRVTKHG